MRRQFGKKASVLTAAVLIAAAAPATASPTHTRFVDIISHDGVKLRAVVCEPSVPGPHPTAILPSAWGGGMTQNIIPCEHLADKGYVTVSYATRGFGESDGEVEVGGPADIADVSSVIDWTLGHTAADPTRVGVGGVSYGAGISILASAADPRIRAVASLSGWADLFDSLYSNETRRAAVIGILRISAEQNGPPSAEARAMLDHYFADNDISSVTEWSRSRSPIEHLDEINHNRPATLMVQAWNETVFPPDQMTRLFDGLTGPKRLEFVPGDHASAETSGLLAMPNESWDSVYRWFDAHLAGTDDSITKEPPLVLKPRGATDRPREYHNTSDEITTATEKYELGADNKLGVVAADNGEPGRGPHDWSTTVTTGRDTIADGGVPLVTYTAEALTGQPPVVPMGGIDRKGGAVWTSEPLAEPHKIRGSSHLRLTATPPLKDGMLVAYLYDVDAAGVGTLISSMPYTWKNAEPNTPMTVDTALPSTAYDVAAGHRVALVVDTEDPLFFLHSNQPDTPLTFSSPAADPSSVTLPLHP